MGASQSNVKKAVLGYLSDKGRVRGRSPISTLCDRTGNDGQVGRKMVEIAVRDLQAEKKILIKTNGVGQITEIIHRQPRRHVDRTERSPQQKREDMFAKGVPAYLRDDMCGPLTIRQGEPKRRQPRLELVPGGELVDNLNACLTQLRQLADDKGYAEGISVKKSLMQLPGATEWRVQTAMKYLQGMCFYVTARTGYQTSSYTVDLERIVTQEAIDEYKQSRREQPVFDEPSVTADGDDTALEEPDGVGPEEVPEPDDLVAQLAEIIVGLEAENDRLQGIVQDQQDSIVRLSDRCTRLTEDLAVATDEVEELREQLKTSQSRSRPVDPKVAAILSRHQR